MLHQTQNLQHCFRGMTKNHVSYHSVDVLFKRLLVPIVQLLRVVLWRFLRTHIVDCTVFQIKDTNEERYIIFIRCSGWKRYKSVLAKDKINRDVKSQLMDGLNLFLEVKSRFKRRSSYGDHSGLASLKRQLR